MHSDELNVVDEDDDYVQSIEDNSGKFSSSKQLVEDVPAMIGVDGNAHGVVHSVGVRLVMMFCLLLLLSKPQNSPKNVFMIQKSSP